MWYTWTLMRLQYQNMADFVIFMLTVIFSNQKPKDGRVIQSLVRLQLMADPKGRAWLDTTVSTEQVLHSIKF